MKSILLSACLLLTAWPVQALDWKPYAVLAGGQSADIITSVRFSMNGSSCTEANLRFRRSDGSYNAPKAIRDLTLSTGGIAAFAWLTGRSHQKAIRWIGKGAAYGLGAVRAGDAVRNMAHCGF